MGFDAEANRSGKSTENRLAPRSGWVSQGWWIVGSEPDVIAPMLHRNSDSSIVAPRNFDSSWGRSVSFEFPVSATEAPVLLLASVDEVEDGAPMNRPVQLFLFPKSYVLYTGPCGQNHELPPGKKYLVDLIPIDSAGNRGKAIEQRFTFEVP